MGLVVAGIIRLIIVIVGIFNVILTIIAFYQFIFVKDECMASWAIKMLKVFKYKRHIWLSLAFIWMIFVWEALSLNDFISRMINVM
mgnify:CR=1 FL=1